MTKPTSVWTACGSCDRDTKHSILFSVEESEYEYRLDRIYQVDLKTHETQLIANIASGAFTGLKLGNHDTFAGTKEKLQHYVIP
jgi:hypothetical protein